MLAICNTYDTKYKRFIAFYFSVYSLMEIVILEYPQKTANFSVRLDPELIDELTKEAKEKGMSRNSLIAQKLRTKSTGDLQTLIDLVGGQENFGIGLAVAQTANVAEKFMERKWWQDAFTSDLLQDGVYRLLEFFTAKGEKKPPKDKKLGEDYVSTFAGYKVGFDITQLKQEGPLENRIREYLANAMGSGKS